MKIFTKKRKQILNYKIYWYKLIPYIIAEIENKEWKALLPLIKKKLLPTIERLYNKNGNWYVLEGLDYFFFGKSIYSSSHKDFLFSDSLKLACEDLSDENKYKQLRYEAKEDIDNFYKNLFKIKY